MERNTDAEYGGENVSRTDDYSADESDWDADQFVASTGTECARNECEDHVTSDGDAFCNFCWSNRVLPELDLGPFTEQSEALSEGAFRPEEFEG